LRSAPVFAAFLLALPTTASPQLAFRFTDLDLRDPHVYAPVPLFGCSDITDFVPLGLFPSFNEFVEESITMDTDGDQLLDLSPLVIFLPDSDIVSSTRQPGEEPDGTLVVHDGLCSAPIQSTACDPDPSQPMYRAMYTNSAAGTCLLPIPGTTRPYSPPIGTPSSPCFVTAPFPLVLEVQGIDLELQDTRIAARYVGDPPTALASGLLMGFLSEGAADTLLLPADLPLVGGEPLSSILPGGSGACPGHDDRDLGPDGVTSGWWFYMNFAAVEVPISAVTSAPQTAGGLAAAAALQLGPARPNPFRAATSLLYGVGRAGWLTIRVLDVRGASVATLHEGWQAAGTHEIAWDGRRAGGVPAASGVYFLRLESAGQGARTRRIVLAR
jgi:hypothetical protein